MSQSAKNLSLSVDISLTTNMKLEIYCDGGSRGNPGLAASAMVVYEPFGNPAGNMRKIVEDGVFLGTATNNTAEYRAVIFALEWLAKRLETEKIEAVQFYLDSNLVVSQLNGLFKVKDANISVLFSKVNELLNILKEKNLFKIAFQYVPREKNSEADRVVNQILDKNS